MKQLFQKNNINKRTLFELIFLFLLCFTIRVLATRGAQFPFWFDSGRDAIISRAIIERGDLKIQGPSASGTGDSVFHGVLYYYLIGPLYTVFAGNPLAVLKVMIGFSSLAVVPVYFLSYHLSKNRKIAFLAGLFFCFSLEAFRSGTWLSNPIIATLTLPTFFYLFYLVFFEHQRKLLPLLTLLLALTQQAAILFAPWWGIVGLGFFLDFQKKQLSKWCVKTIILAIISYLLGVFTMILAQLKVYFAGVFTLRSLAEYASWSGADDNRIISETWSLFLQKIVNSFAPTLPILAIFLAIVTLLFVKNKLSKNQRWMLLIISTSPLWLLSWHFRNMYHTLISLEVVVVICLAWLTFVLWQKKATKCLAIGLFVIFVLTNYRGYQVELQAKKSKYFVPQGAYLKDLLDAIDYSYSQAQGKPFSISTITNPYGFNSLWAYLYSWYGQKNYGYKPFYFGPDQIGIFGGDLLTLTDRPSDLHFSIWEPDQGMPRHLYDMFERDQAKISTASATVHFGSLRVDFHN